MTMKRVLAAIAVLALAGCATVSSDQAIFPADASANKSSFEGQYVIHADKDNIGATVRRHGASAYDVSLYKMEAPYTQGAAIELSAVPLDGGNYVLQVSCLADRKTDNSPIWETATGTQYWVVAAGTHGDFVLGFDLADATRDALAAKYHQTATRQGIKLTGLSPDQARSFFQDWAKMQMKPDTKSNMSITPDSETETREDHPAACRDIPPNPAP